MEKFRTAKMIATFATLMSIVGGCLYLFGVDTVGSFVLMSGWMVGMVSYFFGGFLTAIKMAFSIAKVVWFFCPFPYSLIIFPIAFVFAILAFLFVPIIPIRKMCKENML